MRGDRPTVHDGGRKDHPRWRPRGRVIQPPRRSERGARTRGLARASTRYSMIWSARPSSVCGIVSPSALYSSGHSPDQGTEKRRQKRGRGGRTWRPRGLLTRGPPSAEPSEAHAKSVPVGKRTVREVEEKVGPRMGGIMLTFGSCASG